MNQNIEKVSEENPLRLLSFLCSPCILAGGILYTWVCKERI